MTVETIQKIKAYIQEHIGEKIAVKMLEKRFSYCEQSLLIAFKKYEGISVQQYIIRAKMREARDYLENGYFAYELPRMLGYRSVDAFREAYRKEFGETPKQTEMRLWKEYEQ